jgi:23S rRNA (pseudouridine1915-N3)-methyltransferase
LRVTLVAVGRLGSRTAEAGLVADYLARATATGRALGLGPAELVEVEGRKPGKAAEAEAISAALDPAAHLIACDEHGEAWTSRGLAQRIGGWRDDGVRRLAFVLGGADGLDAALLARAAGRLAFGPQTWPHALARVMLAEQVYRAATILAGSPYHRD